MMRPLLLVSLLAATSRALLAIPSSPCASVCGNVSQTTSSDIVCTDSDFDTTATGRQFEQCISCQLNSTAFDPLTGASDTQWLLYNLRYTLSTCLWGYPASSVANVGEVCVTSRACGPLQSNIQYDSFAINQTEYGYCADINTEFISPCNFCLENINGDTYLNNLFTAVVAGCEQQPPPGSTLLLTGTLFSTTPVNITSPSAVPTYTAPPSSGLTQDAQIGIAVGAIVFALICAGVFIVCRGKRRRRRELQQMQQTEPTGAAFITAQSPPTAALGWQFHGGGYYPQYGDDSPSTASQAGYQWGTPIEKQQVWSPYHSQYTTPVDPQNPHLMAMGYPQPPPPVAHGMATDASLPSDAPPDAIELQHLAVSPHPHELLQEAAARGFTSTTAPILSHPVPGQLRPQTAPRQEEF